jgi:urease accessory protein
MMSKERAATISRPVLSPFGATDRGTAVRGHCHVTCTRRDDGSTAITRQSFAAPAHLSKAHMDRGVLVLNLASPTGGLLDGDELDIDVSVDKRAALCFTTPAAPRVHPANGGAGAGTRQTFRVVSGGLMEVLPEPLIPHAGARFRQHTALDVTGDSHLLFFEWLAPGRVASGEVHRFTRLDYATDLRVDGRLVARERFHLEPSGHSLHALRAVYPAAHFLNAWVLGGVRLDPAALDALHGGEVTLGHGPLPGAAYVIRAICADSLVARRTLALLRELVWQAWDRPPPSTGRF